MPLHKVFTTALIALIFLIFSINIGILIVFHCCYHHDIPATRKFLTLHHTNDENYDDRVAFTIHDNLEPIPRPRLSTLLNGWNITGDVSWLIQFSVIGFPKSGTSTLMFHLRDHPEIHMFPHERCELSYNQQKILIEDMYRQFPPSTYDNRYVRGIKCPMELENRQLALPNYQTYFPKTDFIVGIRHPILCFYNFRVHNNNSMPPAEKLIGRCRKGWSNVCTNRANFHVFLSNLGKTNITTDIKERELIPPEMLKAINPIYTKRKVFLYEVSQLSDKNEIRSMQFRNDLQYFLHLKQPIVPFIWFKPGRNYNVTDNTNYVKVKSNKIDICDARYDSLREILLHQAQQASEWIRKYFLHADSVVVSSKSYFENTIMKTWEIDPCIERRNSKHYSPVLSVLYT